MNYNPIQGYSMPMDRLERARRISRFLIALGVPLFAALFMIIIVVALEGYWLGAVIFLLATIGAVGLFLVLVSPLTRHDQLRISQEALAPLQRPLFSPKGPVFGLQDVVRVTLVERPGLEDDLFDFGIQTRDGSRFRINSLVLYRYDPSKESAKAVREAMLAIKNQVETRTALEKENRDVGKDGRIA